MQTLPPRGQEAVPQGRALLHRQVRRHPQSLPSPGQHGQARARKASEYGIQLRAKQQARRYYGVLESQFAKYFEMAERKPGMTGENLLRILREPAGQRGLPPGLRLLPQGGPPAGPPRPLHRQRPARRTSRPILLKAGDVIARQGASSDKLKAWWKPIGSRPVPKWLDLRQDQYDRHGHRSSRTVRTSTCDVEEHLIVELYTK